MKIHADFFDARPRLALPLAFAFWATALACAIASAWFLMQLFDMRAERPRLEARLARASVQALDVVELAPAADLISLKSRVQALNKLSGLRGWSTAELLDWLASKLPENVYLVSLHHRPREGEALLVAESPSAEALTAFLLRLEREPRFDEVLLSKQGSAGAAGSVAVQFAIRVRWKS